MEISLLRHISQQPLLQLDSLERLLLLLLRIQREPTTSIERAPRRARSLSLPAELLALAADLLRLLQALLMLLLEQQLLLLLHLQPLAHLRLMMHQLCCLDGLRVVLREGRAARVVRRVDPSSSSAL